MRNLADVSAISTPGVFVYYSGDGSVRYPAGLYKLYGTSVAAPIIAGIIGQQNQTFDYAATPSGYLGNLYANYSGNLFDVTSGSNCGKTGATGYICNAGIGYDGPTGLGTPFNGKLTPF